MSRIEKLSIQGIRSFGPDDQDRQVLLFHSPLTLILGPNGTGKTTIIECLKYITTGTLPAGGKTQSTFIHDPKLAHETSVMAQVRLKFRNTTNKVCIIGRSIQATQMAKTIKMSTLDGTINIQRADGKMASASSRCSDLDREMVSLLGVSKAILENVIFCHQEDATWPLSEGKALKEKFDDIFASTRYVKALESLLKTRKETGIKIKEFQVEIKYLKQNKDKAQQIKADLTQQMTKYEASAESTKEVDDKLAPIQEKLIQIDESASGMRRLHMEVEKMKSERKEMERGLRELRDNIADELQDSTETLETRLVEFAGQVKGCEEKLKQYEVEQRRLDAQRADLSDTQSALLLQTGKLEQEEKGHEENLQRRKIKMRKVAESYGFSGFSGAITDGHVDGFNEKLKEHRRHVEQEGQAQKDTLEAEEKKVDANILDINNRLSSLSTEIRLKENQMKENKSKIREIRNKLSRIEGSGSRLSEIKREINNMKQERDDAEKNTNVDELKKEIEELSVLKSSLEPNLKKLEAELTKMHQESTVRAQLDMLHKDKASKDDRIRKLLSKNEEALTELLEREPGDRVGRQLEDFLFTLDKSIEKETKALEFLRMDLAGKRQEHSSLTEQLLRMKAELKDHKDRLAAEIDTQEYDEVRTQLEEKLKIKNEDKGVLDGTSAMFTRYKARLSKANAQCPLCHRDFDDEADIAELVEELEKKLRTLPQKLESVESDIEELQEKFNTILSLEPVTRSIHTFESTDIPELENRIKTTAERIDALTKKIAENDRDLKIKQEKSAAGSAMVPDLTLIDGCRREVREFNKRIAAQSSKVSGAESGRTLPQVQSEKDDIQDQLEGAREGCERRQRRLMNHQEVIARLDTGLNVLGKEQLDLQRDLQDQKEDQAALEALSINNEVLFAEIDECRENIGPLKDDMKKLQREQRAAAGEKERQMAEVRDALSKLQDHSRDIRIIQENINRYVSAGRDAALTDCRQKQTDLEVKTQALDTRRATVLGKLKLRQEELQTQKMEERNLQDNLALHRKRKEIQRRSDMISAQETKLGGLDVTRLESERQQLNREFNSLTKEKHQAQGRQQGIKDQIKSLRKDLDTDQFKDAEEKHRTKIVALKTLQVAAEDLEKFYRALDATIMHYHKTKMEDINKIIRELWRNTYTGNDIDTIELRSNEDESFQLGKRRNFHYRVVMIRADIPIDMRGRCSAGQKVLASLIIRLALAETFCLNCGVLTLDEPTTNLDRENIEGLAYALVEIIKSRSKQKNFQLVVITHDEDFVELLGRAGYVEKFVKVSKDMYGCSRLKEAKVSELHKH